MTFTMNRRRFVSTAAAVIAAPAITTPLVVPAVARESGYLDDYQHWIGEKYGDIWPTDGSILVEPVGDGFRTVAQFAFPQERIEAIQKIARKFEIHFMIHGYESMGIDRRSRLRSSLPAGERMPTIDDETLNEITFRWGYGYTSDLEPEFLEEASLRFWDLRKIRDLYQWVSVRMVLTNGEDDNHPVTVYWTRGLVGDTIHYDRGEQQFFFGG